MRWKAETQEQINNILCLKHNIQAKIHEHGVKGPGYPKMARSYADLVTEFYETRGSRKSSDQQKFRADCINAYGGSQTCEGKVEIWDCVLNEYVDPDLMTAAHITPFFLGKGIMEQIFGPGAHEELFNPSNGLMLRDYIEKKFDQHLLVFTPVPNECFQQPLRTTDTSTSGSIDRWQIRIVDDETKKKQIPTMGPYALTFQDIDGKELVFKTSHRPKARFLYFHYVIALLRARRHRRKGWLLQQTQWELSWATPGRYLRESMLRVLIAAVRHEVPVPPQEVDITEETEAFAGQMGGW